MSDAAKTEARTPVDVLRQRAERQPDRVAYRFLSFTGAGAPEEASLTYGELQAWAHAVAVTLRQDAIPGDRVLMLCAPGLAYVAHFFGCLTAGLIPVPAYPAQSSRHVTRLAAIADACAPRIVLVDGMPDSPLPAGVRGSSLARARWVVTDRRVTDGRQEEPAVAPSGPESVAFLQFTSGSTATPKGVMVTHANLMANAHAQARALGLDSETVVVSWLPPHHDMGLIGSIIGPMVIGFPATLMAPVSFVRSPQRWLEAISDHGATASSAPNFAYRMCTEQVGPEVKDRLDLSRWAVALAGAEPVRPEVLDGFAEAFGRCGFRRSSFVSAYGLAESTLIVSAASGPGGPPVRHVAKKELERGAVRPPTDLGAARALVSSGRAVSGLDIAVVDPDSGRRVPEAQVGEIWVRGDSVTAGYWQAPQASAETFGAVLATGEGPYLRTGDLGVLLDGELFVTGRTSDLMIFRGRNVYPQDIEMTAAGSFPGLATVRNAAFSVDLGGEESLVVVQETPSMRIGARAAADIVAAIRARIAEEHELAVHEIVLVRPRKIPLTSSGKLQRRACRALYLDGALTSPEVLPDVAGPPRDEAGHSHSADIAEQIRALVAANVGLDPGAIDIRKPFGAYGLDSVRAVAVAAALARWLGRDVPNTIAWDHPSIEAAAAALAGDSPAHRSAGRAAQPAADPVVVVGIGCRFPGGVHGPEAFWRLLAGGRSGICEVPPDRWDVDAYYDPVPGVPGRTYTRRAGFIDGVREFDATLFGIPPQDAVNMDPQHRILLEVAWEALEHAGTAPDSLRGSRTGVFVGMSGSDYERLRSTSADPAPIDGYAATGTPANFAANRLSYVLGLEGPSMVVDTACSSSLTALHLAATSLRLGECDLALAGGVNLLLAPQTTLALASGQVLSADGRCKTFDAAADGYVRGEGCGVVVMRRLSAALAAGDDILAVVRGSAVNQDGRSNGLTAPSGRAQQEVIRQALAAAGIAPTEVGYVEAHGTGTPLGDPVEVRALAQVLGAGRGADNPLALGSVKTNIGHLEAAAGIAGFIKAVLAVRRGQIPPHLNLARLNPQAAWDLLTVPTELTEWPAARRVAGVSSFGFGGTNAHVVLEAFPPVARHTPAARPEPAGQVIVKVSGASAEARAAAAGRLAAHVAADASLRLPEVAWAAGVGRADLSERAAVVAGSVEELVAGLEAVAAGTRQAGVVPGDRPAAPGTKIAFLAPGYGPRIAGTLAGVYGEVPVVTAVLDSLRPVLGPVSELPLRVLVAPGPESEAALARTDVGMPALYALAVALGRWWRSVGVRPDAVLGHSTGAYAAAALAGVFSVADGARLIAARGQLMARLPPPGAMAVVFASPGDLAAVDPVASGEVVIAAYNGPRETVLSGPVDAIESVIRSMSERGVRAVRMRVSCASHCAHMDAVLPPLAEAFAGVPLSPPRSPLVSDASGAMAGEELATVGYWTRHTRQPVQFATAVRTLLDRGVRTLVELGPGALLPCVLGNAGRAAPRGVPSVVSSKETTRTSRGQMLESLARLWVDGAGIDWPAAMPRPQRAAALPTYPFQRRTYWLPTARPDPAPRQVPRVEPPPAEPAPPRLQPDTQAGFVSPATATERLIAALWQEHLDLDTVGVHDSFFAVGGNSLIGTMILNQLADQSGLALPPATMFEHPTIAELAAFLDASAPPESTAAATPPGPAARALSVQQRRWLCLVREAGISPEVTPVTFHMALNRTVFVTALRQVVQRHETLRYRYAEAAAQMLPAEQVVPDEADLFADLTEVPTTDLPAAVEQRIGQCRAAVPDPFLRPPWAVRCLELTPDRFMVLLGMQHLEFDGTGIATFFDELQRIYRALLEGTEPHLPTITQYHEYVRKQQEYLAGPIERDRAFFQGLFASVTATSSLPGHPGFDRTTSATAKRLTPARPLARWSALAAAAERMMISPFSIILASYAELVATAVGSPVPVISVIRSGRSHIRYANTIGAFTAPFPLPIHVEGRTPLALIRQCHQLICALTERMDYPPGDMINTVPAFRGFPADSYFSDVSINFLQFRTKASVKAADRTADIELAQPGGRARNTAGRQLDAPRRVVGLQFAAEIIEDQLIAHYWYHTGRLPEKTVRHRAEDHRKIMDKLLAATNEKLSDDPPGQPLSA